MLLEPIISNHLFESDHFKNWYKMYVKYVRAVTKGQGPGISPAHLCGLQYLLHET